MTKNITIEDNLKCMKELDLDLEEIEKLTIGLSDEEQYGAAAILSFAISIYILLKEGQWIE